MNHDDIFYAIILVFCIVFSHWYRKIQDVESKKWIGTFLGLAIILLTSGYSSFHLFLTISISYLLLKFSGRKFHLIIFAFLMGYLLFFRALSYFGLPDPPGHTNMIQMIMILKIIGLAFERDSVISKFRKEDADKDNQQDKSNLLTPAEKEIKEISFINMFHYCFNYIGLLTGPYFTYKTFFDYFNLPFAISAKNTLSATLEKLKILPITIALFFCISYIWPLDYATSEEFYEQRSWLYRLFYVWPTFFIFRMRIYSGMLLAECICTNAGFGAYPISLEPKNGHGPSKEISLELIEKPRHDDYDYETVKNIDIIGVEKCLTFREAMKHWNKLVQYWLAINIYKRFPSKKYRILATMAVSAYWHGVHAGYYFCILGPVIYLPVEDLYLKLINELNPSGTKKVFINAMVWILKFFAFSYMGTAFLLKTVDKIWHYYSSVYHFPYVFWFIIYVVCYFFLKKTKAARRKVEAELEMKSKKS